MRTLFTMAVFGMLLFAHPSLAQDMKHGGIMVEEAWARASAGPAKAGAAYLTLSTMGHDVDRLVEVKSDLANRTELHNHIMEGSVMKMVRVEGGIEVAPGTPTVLQPGGLHVMFMGLKKPFIEGEKLPLTLIFEKAGEVNVEFVVQGVGARGPAPRMNHDPQHKHGS